MKWRSSVVYLIILLVLGGYYYWFEVVQKDRRETAEKDAKKVFTLQKDRVNGIEIKVKDQARVHLKKEGQWGIVDPIRAEADKAAVEDLLGTLSGLEAEREVAAAPDDLKPFGLLEPTLTITIQVEEKKFELLIGDKNPVGDASFAKMSDRSKVVLIAEGNRSALTRGLDELRRRQLFNFQLREVNAVTVAWREGNTVAVERTEDETEWKAPGDPKLKIKKSKVDNLIEQIHWLRAQKFLEDQPKNLVSHGLEPPFVTAVMRLKSGDIAELKLADRVKDVKQIAALSSQLPGVVQVAESILSVFPGDVSALQNRSLLGFKPDLVKELHWRRGDFKGHAVRLDEDSWTLRRGDGEPQPVKNSWHVRSVLWDLNDGEYQKELDPVFSRPHEPYLKIELRSSHGDLVALSWNEPAGAGHDPGPVAMEKDGALKAVSVPAELLKRIEEGLERLGSSGEVGSKK